MLSIFSDLVENYYWFGVFIAALCIYSTIWIYKTILTNPYEYKNNPLILLFLVFSFLSWYAIEIMLICFVIIAVVGLIIWIIKSIHHDFFDNSGNI